MEFLSSRVITSVVLGEDIHFDARLLMGFLHYMSGISLLRMRLSSWVGTFTFQSTAKQRRKQKEERRKKKEEEGFDPLQKNTYGLDRLMAMMNKAWEAGKEIPIGKGIVKYKGRCVAFIQFIPAKTIKHRVATFMAACAESVVMLLFEVYDGSAVTMRDNSAMAVCERLVKRAKLISANGRVLQTDNWYTSMKLAKTMYQKYAWTICGTIVPIENKAR